MSVTPGRYTVRNHPAPSPVTPQPQYFEAPTYYRPDPVDPPAVFLGGGITGVERWQEHAAEVLMAAEEPLVVLNPNRINFPIADPGSAWEQVRWEQHHLHLPTVLTLLWFPASDPRVTTQPIAMAELGQALGEGRQMVVGADPAYPREADVRMLCHLNRPGLVVHSDLDDLLHTAIAMTTGSRRG